MSCATQALDRTKVLGSVSFSRDDVNAAAPCVTVPDEQLEERILAAVMERFMVAPKRPQAVVVELTPRSFTETAVHFMKITKRVEWPIDEADID
jgi:hypothetical protein